MYQTIAFTLFLVGHVTCLRVMFDYTASDVIDDQMPEVINVTFKTETQNKTQFHLKRASYFNLDIPLYTLSTDPGGHVVRKKIKSDNIQNVSFYQDIQNQAVFKVYKSSNDAINKKSKFHMKGEFNLGKSKYFFNSENKTIKNASAETPSENDEVYFLESQNTTSFHMFDARQPPPSKTKIMKKNTPRFEKHNPNMTSSNWSLPLDRHKRAALSDYYVDVAAIVDYKLYLRFLTEARSDSLKALRNIREHYAFVFTGIDMLYQGISSVNYRIHIRLCKIYVTETSAASTFIDRLITGNDVNADTALSALKTFVNGYGNNIVGYFDHAMLFTQYDLYVIDKNYQRSYGVVGIAYIGTMCSTDGGSVSVIEDRTGYSTINTAAHELGHSLSAQHDGLNNRCSFSDRYIMAASNSRETTSTIYHPWQFSPCSVQYFTYFLTRLAGTSRGYNCLGYIFNVEHEIPDVSNRLLGQEVTPDQQCQQIYGSDSHYCRSIDGVNVTDICHAMFCLDPMDVTMCYQEAALIGTSCGDGKICINGRCVSDPYAPQVNERCIFGDQPGIIEGSNKCSSFVAKYVGVCYDDVINEVCCSSCAKIYQSIRGCEYGDNVTNCRKADCAKYQKECCHTCNYGTPFTPTTTTKRTTPVRLTTLPVTRSTSLPVTKSTSLPVTRSTSLPVTRSISLPVTRSTSLSDCSIGDPDLEPDKCNSPSVCLTQRNLCCTYCHTTTLHNSAAVTGRMKHIIIHVVLSYVLFNGRTFF